MDLHQRQQFDYLLITAVERYAERLEQRLGGPGPALERLRTDANGEGVWLDEMTGNLFADFLLDNPAGACFVLQALAQRRLPAPRGGKVEDMLLEMARAGFGALLAAKTEEALEQRASYQAVSR
ncbi:MAG: hypothetical protein MI919_30935 [Holophagales bacterium]|nr:hypothetical protein [Holophagales bacterium]